MRNLAATLVVLAVAVPVGAEQGKPDAKATARLAALRKTEQANPYGKLFQTRQALQQAVGDKANDRTPRVVCGMLVIPADPSLDPKMLITPPQDPSVEYKIRTIDPPVCNPAR
jgi:hypothetical protein